MAGEPDPFRPTVGVVTVDDQEAFRRSARDVIEATAGFELLGEAASGEEALEIVEALSPDLVLVDVRMPGIGGVEAARRLRASSPSTTVVLVSADDLADDVCQSCGAVAFVPKRELSATTLRRVWEESGQGARSPGPAGARAQE